MSLGLLAIKSFSILIFAGKDEESDGISNPGFSDEGTQRKRKMTSISETSLGSPFMQDSVRSNL